MHKSLKLSWRTPCQLFPERIGLIIREELGRKIRTKGNTHTFVDAHTETLSLAWSAGADSRWLRIG